jgi:predicted transcriptional regulator YheO
MFDLDEPPKNKLRKIIFNEFCGLSLEEKMKIVGQMIGKSKKVNQDDIYECMIDLNDTGQKITISRIANLLNCSPRTVYRTMGNELKKEKELLNKQI